MLAFLILVLVLLIFMSAFGWGKLSEFGNDFEKGPSLIRPYIDPDLHIVDKQWAYQNWQNCYNKRTEWEYAHPFEAPGSNKLHELILEEFGAHELYQIVNDGEQISNFASMYLMKLESWPH